MPHRRTGCSVAHVRGESAELCERLAAGARLCADICSGQTLGVKLWKLCVPSYCRRMLVMRSWHSASNMNVLPLGGPVIE